MKMREVTEIADLATADDDAQHAPSAPGDSSGAADEALEAAPAMVGEGGEGEPGLNNMTLASFMDKPWHTSGQEAMDKELNTVFRIFFGGSGKDNDNRDVELATAHGKMVLLAVQTALGKVFAGSGLGNNERVNFIARPKP